MRGMVISGRRVLWGINCILLIAAALIFRPIRTWVDQVLVARFFHPNLVVHELRYHRSSNLTDQTVVQATQFDWGAKDDVRCFGITADNAWIVIEDKPLIAGKVTIPKAVLENSRLYMETISSVDYLARHSTNTKSEISDDSIWQTYLDAKHGSWNWGDLRKFLDSQLQTDSFTSACRTKIDDWVAKGAALAATASALIPDESNWSNPLRDFSDLNQRLGKVDQLSQSQVGFPEELESIERFIEGKLLLIGDTFEQQRNAIKVNPIPTQLELGEHGHPTDFDFELKSVATGLLERSSQRVYGKLGVFMELADRFCRAALADHRPEYDRDFFSSRRDLFAVQQLTAVGMFRCDPVLVPFRLNSSGRMWQAEGSTLNSSATFHYQFDLAPMRLSVKAQKCESNWTFNEVQMEISTLSANPSTRCLDSQDSIEVQSPQWKLKSDGKRISGSLQIDRALVPVFFENQKPMIESALQAFENEQNEADQGICLNFSGTWNTVRWTVSDSELPFWYVKEILLEQQRMLEQRSQQQVAYVEQYFHNEIERLDTNLHVAIDQARLQNQMHAETIVAVRSKLSAELNKLQQVEFARQPGIDVKR